MAEILYGRRYRIMTANLDVSRLRCTFYIEKNMTETPNYSEISIFNLSAASENQIIETGSRIVLEAGYEGSQYGLIFDGEIVQPLRSKQEGTTYALSRAATPVRTSLNRAAPLFDSGRGGGTTIVQVQDWTI
ncbi:MAG: hypothetical protein LBE35_05930 [Clostridiales bacterium]|jgi:hypothetical protein|nr:hypothetical protein [Clostridiales bacterium]